MGVFKGMSQGTSAIIVFLITGIVGTFAFKLMSSQKIQEGGHTKYFYHPYMQTFLMSFSQFLCLIYFYANFDKYKVPLQEGKQKHKFFHFIIPSICDVSLSILQYMALNFITGSTFRILQGGNLITTLLFSKILMKIQIFRRHWLGCSLSIIGLIIVGISGFVNSSGSSTDTSLQLIGIILMLTSLVINGFGFAYEQMLMEKYTIHQYELVGWQGFFGIFMVMFLSLMFTIIPCDFGEDLCVYDEYGHLFIERVDQFFISLFNNWILIILSIFGILATSFSNASGLSITKYFEALMRCLISICKTVGVWIIGLIISFSVGDNQDYQLQSKDLIVNIVKMIGFSFIVAGTLIYNKLILKNWLQKEEKLHKNQGQQSSIPIMSQQT